MYLIDDFLSLNVIYVQHVHVLTAQALSKLSDMDTVCVANYTQLV